VRLTNPGVNSVNEVKLDEFKVYERALNASEVNTLFSEGSP
jgi:hypothetical protein